MSAESCSSSVVARIGSFITLDVPSSPGSSSPFMIRSHTPHTDKSYPGSRKEQAIKYDYAPYIEPSLKCANNTSQSIKLTAFEPCRLSVCDAQIIPHQGDVSRYAEGGNMRRSNAPGNFASFCEIRRHDHASDHRGSARAKSYISNSSLS